MAQEHIVIAGQNGAGSSTTAVNVTAALADEGYLVAHVGHDARRLSTAVLRGPNYLLPCGGKCPEGRTSCVVGYKEILCVETGNAINNGHDAELGKLCRFEELARHSLDFVIHDISGAPEAVRAVLSRTNEPWRIFVVTPADIASIHTLNRFIAEFNGLADGNGRFGGVIVNNLSGSFFESMASDFIRATDARLVANIPRSMMVSLGRLCTLPVREVAPRGHVTAIYRKIARIVVDGTEAGGPRHLDDGALAAWSRRWREIADELENGIVRDGAAI